MKKRLIYLTILSCLGFTACRKDAQQEVSVSDCLNKTVNDPVIVDEVKSLIYGEWQLKKFIVMNPSPKLPDLRVAFKPPVGFQNDKYVADIYTDGKLISTMYFSLKQKNSNGYQYVEIVSDSTNFQNGDFNFLRGTIRVCENQMMIDNGIASDASGYVFIKVGEAK